MIGYDKSEFQAVGAGPFGEFEIDRAGNGRRRDYNLGHISECQRRGIPVTLYLYCEPGSTSAEFQADLLCGVARDYGIPQSVKLYADIEEGAGDLSWFEDRFIARVNWNGWPCDTYSGDYFWRAHGLNGRGDPWKAAYGSNDGRPHTPPSPPFSIWQYTSVPLDTNTADGANVARLFGGTEVDMTPEEHQWLADTTFRAAIAVNQLQELTGQHMKDVWASTLEASQTSVTYLAQMNETLQKIAAKLGA